jgi:hypothetical protein
MANRGIAIMDLVELVRLLRTGASDRTLTQVLRHNRRTITKYRVWAQEQGLLEGNGPLPPAATLQRLRTATLPSMPPPQQVSSLEAYQEEIVTYRARGHGDGRNPHAARRGPWPPGQLQCRHACVVHVINADVD